jgi:anti-sigma factor RsiW
MSQVDRELLRRYLSGELDDAGTTEVERHVAESQAWADALTEEAQVELALFEVADAAAETVAEAVEAPAAEPGFLEQVLAWFRRPVGLGTLVAVAAAMLLFVRLPADPAPSFRLEVTSGDQEQRSGAPSAGPTRYSSGSALDLTVVPSEAWSGNAERVLLLLDGKPVEGAEVSNTASGGVEVYAVWGEDLTLPAAGDHTLEVVLELPDGQTVHLAHAFSVQP